VSDARDRAIVRSTIELGHQLGLAVVAEGVEDAPTLELLESLGCDMAQGYLLGRPMPAAEVGRWLGALEQRAA
jgi:EAL domain-containing protein (putative c-di-GMP-specific phosphodiesterase class I)